MNKLNEWILSQLYQMSDTTWWVNPTLQLIGEPPQGRVHLLVSHSLARILSPRSEAMSPCWPWLPTGGSQREGFSPTPVIPGPVSPESLRHAEVLPRMFMLCWKRKQCLPARLWCPWHFTEAHKGAIPKVRSLAEKYYNPHLLIESLTGLDSYNHRILKVERPYKSRLLHLSVSRSPLEVWWSTEPLLRLMP